MILATGVLGGITFAFAQDDTARIPAKGFALHSKDGHFNPLNLPVTNWVMTIFRLRFFMRVFAIAISMRHGMNRSLKGIMLPTL